MYTGGCRVNFLQPPVAFYRLPNCHQQEIDYFLFLFLLLRESYFFLGMSTLFQFQIRAIIKKARNGPDTHKGKFSKPLYRNTVGNIFIISYLYGHRQRVGLCHLYSRLQAMLKKLRQRLPLQVAQNALQVSRPACGLAPHLQFYFF